MPLRHLLRQAAAINAELAGIVLDPSGASVQSATVHVENIGTGPVPRYRTGDCQTMGDKGDAILSESAELTEEIKGVCQFVTIHSTRSAIVGAIDNARRAGTTAAIAPANRQVRMTDPRVMASIGLIPSARKNAKG